MSMKTYTAEIRVTLKRGVLDPQGKAIEGALDSLGFDGVGQVRQGKTFDVTLDADSKSAAEQSLNEMCEKLLANTVIESYRVEMG